MDVIRGLETTAIHKIIPPTMNAFVSLLNKKKADIEKIERQEFKYGEGNRHYMDVYYPSAASALSTPNGKLPVLLFTYGGGYDHGSRRYPEPYEAVYRGLGSFFAVQGFLTVVSDYRLVPEVQFPSGSEDVRDALLWLTRNATEVAHAAADSASARTELDPGYVFMMGHSAGSTLTFALHAYPPLRESLAQKGAEVGLQVRGLVLAGTPWYFNVTGSGEAFPPSGGVFLYLGDEAQQRERESRGLWAALTEENVRAFPDMLLVQGEKEPDWLKVETKDLMENEIREKFTAVGRELQKTYIAVGHNHISPVVALGTGDEEGEKWGYAVVEWIKTKF